MKQIVSIVWFKIFPPKYGGQKGIAIFTKYLSDYFSIGCICSKDNEPGEQSFEIAPTLSTGKKQFLLPASYWKIYRYIKNTHCKAVVLEHVYYGIAGILLKKLCRIKLITHSHNIEFERFKDQGVWWWRILYQLEKITYRYSDHIFFKTKQDQSKAIELFAIPFHKTTVVPYGIEKKVLNKEQSKKYLQSTYSLPSEHKIILFASTLDYLPNAKAVELIYREIAKALSGSNSTILICGRNKIKGFEYLRELKATNVIYCGEVTNIDDYFNGADVFIDPVEIAAGIQTKILDALSFNLNVVCYPQLLNGIDVEITGNKLFIAKQGNPTDFINNIKLALIRQSSIPSSFYDYYEWGHIVKRTASSIRQIIN